jgi:predicted RNA binding protein YcfA (HicA-like mRNA interferase family)
MPKKIRELKQMLRKAGFTCKQGKGGHSKWQHPQTRKTVVLSGNDGKDAKHYQERDVAEALADTRKNR